HETHRVSERGLDRVLRIAALEAPVARAKDDTLQALPSLHQRKPWAEKMRVVDASLRIDEVHRREIAFATLRCRDAPEAADRDGACAEALIRERAEHGVKRNAMAARDHEIRHRSRFANERNARARAGRER